MLKGLARMTMAAGAISLFTAGCMVDSLMPMWMITAGVILGIMLLIIGDVWLRYLWTTERIRRMKRRRRRIEMKKSA